MDNLVAPVKKPIAAQATDPVVAPAQEPGQAADPVVTAAASPITGALLETPEADKPKLDNLSSNPMVTVLSNRKMAITELFFPIGDSNEISRLEMRRPKVEDTLIAEKLSEGDRSAMFIARLSNICEVPFSDFEDLDELEDLENLTEAYGLLKSSKHKAAESNPNITMSEDRRECVITLNHPITVGEVTYSELKMRRPTLRDSSAAEKESSSPTESLAHKMASICSVPFSVIAALDDIDDFTSLDEAYGMFRRSKARRAK